MMAIHPSCDISKESEIADDVVIGPFCVIRGRVKIGSGTVLDSHVSLGCQSGIVEVGRNNRIHAGAIVGGPPQDISYRNESTRLVIGDHNVIREMATINIGTPKGGELTRIGNHTLIMAYAHIAHDCHIGDYVQVTNSTQLGGHVIIEDHAKVGGMCGINQFVKIGRHAFVAGDSAVNKDVLPYTIAQGKYAVMRACNRIGMERAGYPKEEIESVHRAIRIVTQGGGTVEQSLTRIQRECEPFPALKAFVEAMQSSDRGIAI